VLEACDGSATARGDVWALVESQLDDVLGALLVMAPEPVGREGARARFEQGILHGSWDAHDADVRASAVRAARDGRSASSCAAAITRAMDTLEPLLVRAHASDQTRLCNALAEMRRFGARTLGVFIDAFTAETETTVQEKARELVSFALDVNETERAREALERLRASGVGDDPFRALVESVTDYAIFMLDPKGHVITWNRGAERLKGYTAAEIIGHHYSRFYLADDIAHGVPQKQLLIAEPTGRCEAQGQRVCKDGRVFWAEVVINAARSPSGELVGFTNVTRDVTARKASEAAWVKATRETAARLARRDAGEELRAQETRFRALIEKSDDGIALTDRDAKFIYLSGGARRILGLGDEGLGTSIGAIVHPEDRARVLARSADLRSTSGESVHYEVRIVRPAGEERWIDVHLVNRLEDEAVRAVVANFSDVTERRKALEVIQESEARFNRLWDSGVIGVAIGRARGELSEANDALLSMVGYTREDINAGRMHWTDMTPPEWQASNEEAGRQLAMAGVARPWEKEYRRKDGTRVPVLTAVATLSEDRTISLVVDLSARKAAERERARAEEALAETAAQLRQAQKMDAIGRLAGGVAHDFNNLLSIIISYAELALGDLKAGDPLGPDIEEIKRAAVRAADLTSQLLMFSRQQVLSPTVCDLNAIVLGMDKMLRRMLNEDITLVTLPAQPLRRVLVDRGSFEQVVMNLAVNARDAMPTGGQLTIETTNVDLDDEFVRAHVGAVAGPHVMVSVTDTGTGMDAETLTKIFDPFFTTKPVGKGTGLGLSTVFGIVRQSGGTVWVDSAPGRGTTFKIYLPATGGPLAREETPAPTAVSLSETILLVEDDPGVRAVALGILTRAGYRVLVASNGGEAWLIADTHLGEIDLLLSDVVMPHVSGPVMAERLKKRRPEMKVLFMSGYTDDSVLRHGVLESSIAFLQKPITPTTLRRKVREVLDAKEA
jgi:two-component system cell cycle sensor histidine kinase/response regulator CckA